MCVVGCMVYSSKKQEQFTISERVYPAVFCGDSDAYLFSYLCFVVVFLIVFVLSCVPNVAIFSGLSIIDFPFGFL